MKKLMTIAEVAKELNIPESTARYYRDNFIDFIPSVGEGRKKRYRPETVEVLRFIAEGFKRKLTATEIEDGLNQIFTRNLDIDQPTVITTAATQQQSENEVKQYALQLQIALEQMSKTMQVIANQKEEIAELRKHIADVEEQQQKQTDYINNKLEERDRKLMGSIREIQEVKKEIAAATQEKNERWWNKIFKK